MPDLPIVIPDTAAAPKDYTLSGTQELQLKTVRALIDGTGAGSAFLPTLQLLDPNGHVMWEGATSSTVAAGGSADVSWFPRLGAQSGGGSSTATPAASANVEQFGATTFVGNIGTVIAFEFFNTTDTSVFATNPSGSVVLPPSNTVGDKSLMLLQGGAYIVDATVLFSVAPGAVGMDTNYVAMQYTDLGFGSNIEQLAALPGPMGSNLMLQAYHLYMVRAVSAPALLSVAVQGATAGNYTVAEMSMVVHWLGSGIGADHSVY